MHTIEKEIFSGQLRQVLARVSRSFYLSLKVLPSQARTPMALAYLLARAADTIADTQILPRASRKSWLEKLKAHVMNPQPREVSWDGFAAELVGPQEVQEERELLESLGYLLAILWEMPVEDRRDIQNVLAHLIGGMAKDLERFVYDDKTNIGALKTKTELEKYCFDAAGIVGVFWSDMMMRHDVRLANIDPQRLRVDGVAFGCGLQMVNVIKDVARDLTHGRCYWPLEVLSRHQLEPIDLLNETNKAAIAKVRDDLIGQAADLLHHGLDYLSQIPKKCFWLRLAVLWPLWIGLATLEYLAHDPFLMSPARTHKISRWKLRSLLFKSIFAVFSDRWLENHFQSSKQKLHQRDQDGVPNWVSS